MHGGRSKNVGGQDQTEGPFGMKVLLLSGQMIGVSLSHLALPVPPTLNQHLKMQNFQVSSNTSKYIALC